MSEPDEFARVYAESEEQIAKLKAIEPEPRPGFEILRGLPEGTRIYDLAKFEGVIFVATSDGVYVLEGNKLVRLKTGE